MRDNSDDRTIERNYVQKWRFLVRDYERVKAKRHPQFRFVQDFYAFHGTNRQTFAKYYNRYRQSGADDALLPRKRGPKWKSRRTLPLIEERCSSSGARASTATRLCHTQAGAEVPHPGALDHLRHRPSPRPEPVDQAHAGVQAPDHQDPCRGAGPPRLPLPEQGPDRGSEAAPLPGVGARRLHAPGLGGGGGRPEEPERDVRGAEEHQPAERRVRSPVRGHSHGQRGRGGFAGQQGQPPDGADVPGAGHHAPLHAALPAADQREGRAVLADAERGPAGRDDVRVGGGAEGAS